MEDCGLFYGKKTGVLGIKKVLETREMNNT